MFKMKIEEAINEVQNIFFKENEGRVYRILLKSMEAPLLRKLLNYTGWNQIRASKILGINRNTLRAKIKKLGIRR